MNRVKAYFARVFGVSAYLAMVAAFYISLFGLLYAGYLLYEWVVK